MGGSLHVPVPDFGPTARPARLTLFGSLPGAFDATGAALRTLLGLDETQVVLDAHLDLPGPPDSYDGLAAGLLDHRDVNRALGVLLARGHPLPEARTDLRRRAAESHCSVPDAARAVLADATFALRRPAAD